MRNSCEPRVSDDNRSKSQGTHYDTTGRTQFILMELRLHRLESTLVNKRIQILPNEIGLHDFLVLIFNINQILIMQLHSNDFEETIMDQTKAIIPGSPKRPKIHNR
ncbi:hypothetical protein L195_g038623 [Trifolium pratense]|uniref:Uncharacterized protein n=1 Tax=Trifolium pratense TaxID=57577 RepID=A0A2K3LVP6_TRIPR|nr:hypothetical protein L195_g038623 [Trifolium pratense]